MKARYHINDNFQSPRPVLSFSSEYPENCGDYNNLFVGVEGESDYQTFEPRDVYTLPINHVRLGDMIRELEAIHLTPEKIEINNGQRNMTLDTLVTSVSTLKFNPFTFQYLRVKNYLQIYILGHFL